jgi:hypothetical protein
VPDLFVVISPESESNKILVTAYGFMSISSAESFAFLRLTRNGVPIAQSAGAADVNASFVAKSATAADVIPFSISFYDSPNSTSGLTYAITVAHTGAGQAVYFNRNSSTNSYRGIATISAMEVRA